MRMFRKGNIKINNILYWQTAKMNILLVTCLTVGSLRKLKTAKFIDLWHRLTLTFQNVDLLPSHTQSLF